MIVFCHLPDTLLTEIVDPRLATISCAAVAKLDNPTVRDLQLVRLGLAALAYGSDVYPVGSIRLITEGRGIHTYLTRDAAIVSLTVPESTKSDPAQILISLLKEPSFSDESISQAIGDLQRGSSDYWLNEVDPEPFMLTAATKDDLLSAFHRVFQVAHLTVGELGPRASAKDTESWANAVTDWPPPTEPPPLEDPILPKVTGNQSRVSTGEIIGSQIDPASADFGADVLALYAMGAGKCAALFRISREKHAWSYRQESILYGAPTGFDPRLFVAMSPDLENSKRLETLKGELKDDVATWDDTTLQEALGMAESNLIRHLPYGPFIFANQPLSDDPEQRLDFGLYWKSKTGEDWSPTEMLAKLRKIDLAGLKSAASKILDSSQVHYLPADY